MRELNGTEKQLKPQTIANKKWMAKNKARSRYLRDRSTTKCFILGKSTIEDLEKIEEYIKIRREEL